MNPVMQMFSSGNQGSMRSKSPLMNRSENDGFRQLLSTINAGENQQMPLDNQESAVNLLKKMKAFLEKQGVKLENLIQTSHLDASEGKTSKLSDIEKVLAEGSKEEKSRLFDQLQALIEGLSELDSSMAFPERQDEWVTILQSLASELQETGKGEAENKGVFLFGNHQAIQTAKMDSPSNKDLHQVENQLQDLWQTFQKLTQGLTTDVPAKQVDVDSMDRKQLLAIKNVLNDMVKLMSSVQAHNKSESQGVLAQVTKEGTTQQRQIFADLFQSLRNKEGIPKSYHQQTPVSAKDIGKWISQSLAKQPVQEQPNHKAASSINISTVPMTKVEQYVIHVNQNQSQPSMQKQFIQEFERVLNSSRMFFNKAGNMEMQLKLRPANLGDMTVKFAQLNGELAVKIMVSTQAAKDMLDGNMGQLRHMFSPQQVIVEKNEGLASQHPFQQESELEDGSFEEQKDERSRQGEGQRDDQTEEELSFRDLLMNEKV